MAALRALDLYCKAGGASRGLARAGFEVSGADIQPQTNYPFEFFLCDVLQHLEPWWIARHFDFVWASPPCQANSALRHAPNARLHRDLIPQTRELLRATGLPYVIENVEGAEALHNPVTLCGSHFGLGVEANGAFFQLRRHRLFEANFNIPQPECAHTSPVIGVYGGHVRCRAARHGGRRTKEMWLDTNTNTTAAKALDLVGVNMTMDEYSNAIPPAYACYIGTHALAHIASGAANA